MKNFFIIGAPKTGTTLLARLIDSHPDIACTTELFPFHVVGGKRKASPNFKNKLVDHGLTDMMLTRNFHPCSTEMLSRVVKENIKDNSYVKEVMTALFDLFGKNCRAKIVGDKFPWYIGFIDDMLEMFPDAKYIYTVRDPRAVYNSAKHFLRAGRANQIVNMMLRYDEKIEKQLEWGNFYTLQYEDFFCDFDSEMEWLCNFLDASKYPLNTKAKPLYPARFKHMPNVMKPLDPSIIDKWKTKMTPKEIKHINSISKKFMEKYGYEN